jgi:AcrR family transcriptional regulator
MPRESKKNPKTNGRSAKISVPFRTKKPVGAHVLNSGRPRRRPRQERARFTATAILRAAAEVIDDVGWARASTNLIAERAGVSIGSLYQYFDSKEIVLLKLIEQHCEATYEVVWSAMAQYRPQQPVEDLIRSLFQGLIGLHQKDPVLTRVLSSEEIQRRVHQIYDNKSKQFMELLKHFVEQIPEMQGCQTTAIAYILVTVAETLTRWIAHNAPTFLSTDVLIDEVVIMLSGYLTRRYPGEWPKV